MSEYKDPHPWPLFHSKGSEPEETFIVRQSRIQEASVPSSGHQFCISIVCPIFPCRCEIHIWFLPVQKEWKYLDFCTEDHSYLLHKPKSYFLWGLSHLKKKKASLFLRDFQKHTCHPSSLCHRYFIWSKLKSSMLWFKNQSRTGQISQLQNKHPHPNNNNFSPGWLK